jgi:hypothetical protein
MWIKLRPVSQNLVNCDFWVMLVEGNQTDLRALVEFPTVTSGLAFDPWFYRRLPLSATCELSLGRSALSPRI